MRRNKKNKRNMKSWVALALAILLLLPLFAAMLGMLIPASALVTQAEIDDLLSRSEDLAEERKELAAELEIVKDDKAKAVQAKAILDGEMTVLQNQINVTQATIDTFDTLIAEKEIALAEAEEAERAQFELFCRRVRAMEEAGSVSYLSILFGAKDFPDLLDQINMVNEVVEYDNAVAKQLEQMRLEIVDARQALQEARDAQQAQKEALEEQKVALEDKIKQAQALVSEIMTKEAEYQAAIAEYRRLEDETAAEIDKLQKALAAQNIKFDPGTGYQWPLPGYYRIISRFGPRIHPITGKYGDHTGIDIPAPRGTPIIAARGGVVLLARSHNSYGNYVSLSHSATESTLYAHMTHYIVSEGDIVKQGQVIGYVGTTGSSTGYHLHFEVRINGARRNAVDFYPSLKGTLYFSYGGYTTYNWEEFSGDRGT